MRRPRPIFLARASYRHRRLTDAACLLPVLGAFLVGLPILWGPAETTARDTAPDGVYLFLVWLGLVIMAAVLAPGLRSDPDLDPDEPGPEAGSKAGPEPGSKAGLRR